MMSAIWTSCRALNDVRSPKHFRHLEYWLFSVCILKTFSSQYLFIYSVHIRKIAHTVSNSLFVIECPCIYRSQSMQPRSCFQIFATIMETLLPLKEMTSCSYVFVLPVDYLWPHLTRGATRILRSARECERRKCLCYFENNLQWNYRKFGCRGCFGTKRMNIELLNTCKHTGGTHVPHLFVTNLKLAHMFHDKFKTFLYVPLQK